MRRVARSAATVVHLCSRYSPCVQRTNKPKFETRLHIWYLFTLNSCFSLALSPNPEPFKLNSELLWLDFGAIGSLSPKARSREMKCSAVSLRALRAEYRDETSHSGWISTPISAPPTDPVWMRAAPVNMRTSWQQLPTRAPRPQTRASLSHSHQTECCASNVLTRRRA